MRRIAALAACALLGGCAAAARPAPPASDPPSASTAASEEIRTSRRQTIAVLPFENHAVTGRESLDHLSESVPDRLAAALAEKTGLRVVERRALLRVLQEQKLGTSVLASNEGRLRAGKLAGAQAMVFGEFVAVGETLTLTARVVDAESGVVARSVSVHGSPSAARALADELGAKLAADLGVAIERRAEAAGAGGSATTAELYAAAVEAERAGRTGEAIDTLRRLLARDPKDTEAKERLRKLLNRQP